MQSSPLPTLTGLIKIGQSLNVFATQCANAGVESLVRKALSIVDQAIEAERDAPPDTED